MRLPRSPFAAALAVLAAANATTLDDINAIQGSCENASKAINTSLNNTQSMNTAELVQDIGFQVGASQANLLDENQISNQSNRTNASTTTIDPAYLNYAGSLNTLAEALMRRGRIFHEETNMPVYVAIQGLAAAVENYALQLRNASVISQDAFVRTLIVESDLVEAESAWADEGNSPARRGEQSTRA